MTLSSPFTSFASRYSSELTTYDLVKCLAIALMLVDHVGYFFYPDETWMRVVGRACLPIWFFLIGYAASRDLGHKIWIGAGVLGILTVFLGGAVFPLNVLFTMIAIRLVIDHVAMMMFRSWDSLLYGFTALALIYVPSMVAVEYGTSGLLLALFGYAVRHKEQIDVGKAGLYLFYTLCVIFFAASQSLLFSRMDPGFDRYAVLANFLGIGAASLLMARFQPLRLISLSESLPKPLILGLNFAARHTLEIYVIHLILFRLAAVWLELPGHAFMAFRWVY